MSTLTSVLGSDMIDDLDTILNASFNTLNNDKAEASAVTSLLSGKIQVSSVAGSILSITTATSDKVVVMSKGTLTGSPNHGSVALLYDGVLKDSIAVKQASSGDSIPFMLMYSETPGSGTGTIITSVTANGSLVMEQVKIITQIIS